MNADPTLLDTVYHSAAVVGLNTSAQLEAGILGRPVLTILAPEFEEGQQGTLHFSYLLKEHGGFVDVAPDFEVHRRQLAAAVSRRLRPAGDSQFHRAVPSPERNRSPGDAIHGACDRGVRSVGVPRSTVRGHPDALVMC